MTALPADILGEILCYVRDLSVVNALALTCKAGAQFVRESADHIADELVECKPPDYTLMLPNGVKHGDIETPKFDSDTFTVTYCRGVVASWQLCLEDGTIIRGHPDTHYVLVTSANGDRYSNYVGVYDNAGTYRRLCIGRPYRGQRRPKGYVIDDVIVPSVIERWAVTALNIKQPTRPYIVFCDTKEQANELNALGIVDAMTE